jgi:hypothetical protein
MIDVTVSGTSIIVLRTTHLLVVARGLSADIPTAAGVGTTTGCALGHT